jgi:NAD(P)-dependent dehydrogenase (short-subunit alcohol dehydrogenase family)
MASGTSLTGQRVAVVGGSSGIGLAVAQAAGAHGAEVFVGSRDPSRAGDAVDGATAIPLDVTDDASVNAFFEQLGSLNHLVCTAASGFPAGLFRAPAEDVRGLMESKFWGQYRCARAAAPLLGDGGSITFTSGIRSRRPARGTEAFTVVNMAVEGMARALALELAPLRVNVVAPGTVHTPVFDFMPVDAREKRLEAAAGQTTVGRVAQPPEIAEVFLMCMTNGFLSGTVIDADGGAMLA